MSLSALLDLAKNLGGLIAVVFYVSIVLWTYKDARRRLDDPILIATAVAASMLPIVGVLVYLLLRPPEYLQDVRERQLEIRAMEISLGHQQRCPRCRASIDQDFLACPNCATRLRRACSGCDKPLDPRWVICPYCETEVPNMPPPQRPSRGTSRPSSRGSVDTPRRDERDRRDRRERRTRDDERQAHRSPSNKATSSPAATQLMATIPTPEAPAARRTESLHPSGAREAASTVLRASVSQQLGRPETSAPAISTEPLRPATPLTARDSRSGVDDVTTRS